MDKVIKLSIVTGILIVSLSVAYYFVVFLPSKEKFSQDQEQKRQQARTYCNQWAIDKAKDKNLRARGTNEFYGRVDYDGYFDRCLREQGVAD